MANPIIGRKAEMHLLEQYINSDKAEFIALYGRRRVGKTFLIRRYFDNQFAFDMTGIIEGKMSEQMAAFNDSLRQYGYQGDKVKTWLDAFFALRDSLQEKLKAGEKCIVFIDELPCLDTPRSGFVRALGHFWNSWAAWQPGMKLIVCGSATSWMVRNVIDNHGGLHDRVTHEMALKPFSLAEVEEFFTANSFQWSRLGILHAYMAVGGIPYYLSMFRPTESPAQGIDRLFFDENAELAKEYHRLFSSLFRNPAPYLSLIKLLATKPSGMTREEIAAALGVSNNGFLGDLLTDLVYCDFLRSYQVREKRIKSNSCLYKLVDFYTIFYHTFIRKTAEPGYWLRMQGTPTVNTWTGLAYERVCMSHIAQIKRALGISSVATEAYTALIKEGEAKSQIDLVIERADKMINLCEIKYSETEYTLTQEEFIKLGRRVEAFKNLTQTHYGVVPTLITTFGLTHGMYADHIHVSVTLDDLFAYQV
jgi:hypothetical protein